MRIQHGIIALLTFILAAVTTLGSVYSEQFSHAALVESGSFDALAHALFDDIFGAGQSAR